MRPFVFTLPSFVLFALFAPFIEDLRQHTLYSKQKLHSQKHGTFPLTALLLRHVPLDLPFRRSLRVRGMLQRSSDLPLPLHTEQALSYVAIHFRELATSHFGTDHVLQFDCCKLQLLYTRQSVGGVHSGVVRNAPILESRTLSSSVIRYTGVRI